MSSEEAHSSAGVTAIPPASDDDSAVHSSIKSKAPNSLIQLKQDLTAWLLMERADIRDLGNQEIFNKQQVAKLSGPGRGLTTVKLEIKKGKLKTLPSGWITKGDLIVWLGYDPIQAKINKIVFYEKEILRLTNEIEQIILDA